jgi:hypothetical protein
MITPKIRILKRSQINDARWDDTIRTASNSLPYAYTWYLDALCPKWMALVIGEYECVMPLPIGRKWGFLYVYQPLFCQQLGVFYKRRSDAILEQLITAALRKFVFVNLNLNYDNHLTTLPTKAQTKKKNLILTLSGKHSTLQKEFSDNTLRNIKKGQKAGLKFEEIDQKDFESFTDFYIKNTAVKDKAFKSRHTKYLHKLTQQFIIHDCGRLYVVKTSGGDICAGVIVVENGNRIIHLIPAADEYARQNGGMHFLVDAVLNHYSATDKVYDFEGSSVDSIARFYEGFGATAEPFYMITKSFLGRK